MALLTLECQNTLLLQCKGPEVRHSSYSATWHNACWEVLSDCLLPAMVSSVDAVSLLVLLVVICEVSDAVFSVVG